jgi:methylase of polypeptide subunit release factors
MALTPEQEQQVKEQLAKHDRTPGSRSILLDKNTGTRLELYIDAHVFASDMMSSGIYLASFLYKNKELYKNKKALDLGCGPGTQGIVMALNEAQSVDFSDISPLAVNNTRTNIQKYMLKNCRVFESNLFDDLPASKYDIVVFNHPFFPATPGSLEEDPLLGQTMLGGTELIRRFFNDLSHWLSEEGVVVMPYFHLAGPENDPVNHIGNNFEITHKEIFQSETGLQIGGFSIYIIKKTPRKRGVR